MNSIASSKAGLPPDDVLASPCIGVCTLGPGDICIGCLRTSAEIGSWTSLSAQERHRVIADLPQRLEALFAR